MSEGFTLGCFTVRAEEAEVAAFRSATGLPIDGDALPWTFPMRWLAAPAVRAALTTMIPEANLVPFHESQTFEYAHPLRVGVPYAMTVAARRAVAPDRLIVTAEIADPDGTAHASCETILRLVCDAEAAA